jgi:hypothetical protein
MLMCLQFVVLHPSDLNDGLGEEHDGDADDGDKQNDDLYAILRRFAVFTPHGVCLRLNQQIVTVLPT